MKKQRATSGLMTTLRGTASFLAAIVTILTFTFSGAMGQTLSQTVPVVGSFFQAMGHVFGGAGQVIGGFSPWIAALVVLVVVASLKVLLEVLNVYYTVDVRPSEVATSALLLSPLAGIWIWAFHTQVSPWGYLVFAIGYLGAILAGTRVAQVM
jgi:hypothetical protein